MITMMEDNSDCKWIWNLMNVEEDTIVQGSSIANQDPCSSNKVDQGVSLWEPSIINTVSNDETKIVARNSTTTNAGPWTEDEHRLFLLGLEKHGKGKWKPISVEFVKTRLPSQVASHAQKYFKRLARPARKTKRKRPSIFDIDITHVKIDDDQKKSGAQVNEAKGALESGCYNIDNQLEDCWIELPSFEDDDDLPSGLFYLNKDVLQYQVIEPLMVDYNYAKLGVQVTAATTAATSDEILRLTNGTFESSCIDIDGQMKDYWLDLPTLENLPTL